MNSNLLTDLQDLYEEYITDPNFEHLREDGINFVPGSGALKPKVMIIGEAPGRMENAKKRPFIGPAGRVLTECLKEISLDLINEVFITNVVKYWPRTSERRTRPPVDEEIECSKTYLLDEIEIVDPLVIGLCGRSAINTFFPGIYSVKEKNGHLLNGKFVPLFHPASVLHKPETEPELKMGFRMLRNIIDVKQAQV